MDTALIRRPAIALLVVLAAVACDPGSDAPTTTTSDTSDPTNTTTTTVPRTTTTMMEEDVQAAIDWFVEVLNGEDVDANEYDERFTEQFRQQVPLDTGFLPLLEQMRPSGPFVVVERSGEGAQGEAVAEGSDGVRARIIGELDDQGRFAGLLIQPAEGPTLENPPASVEEAHERLAEIGALRSVSAEVVEGTCQPVDAVALDEPAPLGSVFKLYVLAALGEEIGAGNLSWDDELEIRDELKSVPSGVLQDRTAGETVSVHEAAELMISISDNTATDHLIDLVGRERVEEILADYGNAHAELNMPFMTTLELTALKVGPAEGLRTQWIDGDEQARRSILEQISDITPADLPISEWVEPRDPDVVEWFASPSDLCTLGVRLLELSERVPEIDSILSLNPGVPSNYSWDRLWFKGGSEPGLLAAWFLTEAEGRVFITAGSVVDTKESLESEESILLFAAIRDLLAP